MTAKNLRQFEFKLGKLGIILFLAGFTILVFAGFLLGVQVGRNLDTYPDWIARGIPRQILDLVGPSGGPIRRDIPVGKPDVALFDASAGDQQAVKTAEGEKEPAAGASPATPGTAPQSGEATSPAGEAAATATPPGVSALGAATKAPATQTAVPAAKEATKNEKAPPESKAVAKKEKEATVQSGRYTVQVVSFREKEKAESLSKKIRGFGYTPQIAKTDISGKGQWYRVTVEGFETKQAAEKAVETLTSKIKGLSCVIKGK